MIKTCEFCGKEFKAEKDRRKYCSPKCSGDARRTFDPKRICPHCGEEFIANAKRQKYCSHKCSALAKRRPRPTRVCPYCGKSFTPLNDRQKHCSRRCGALNRDLKDQERTCKVCGETFTTRNPLRIFCSKKCSNNYHRAKYRQRSESTNERTRRVSKLCQKLKDDLFKLNHAEKAAKPKLPPVQPPSWKPPKPKPRVIIPAAIAENRRPTTEELLDWIFSRSPA